MPTIADRYKKICDRIEAAAARSRRATSDVRLLAVSKTFPAEAVQELVDCGHILFGENKLQEAEIKVPALPSHLEWHFIGHLQKNKVRKVLPLCGTIESVDSLELAERIDRIAADLECNPKVFLQVNVAGETSKSGFSADSLRENFARMLGLKQVGIRGLMTIPPAVEDPDDARPYFRQLMELRNELEQAHGTPLPEISMGMSHDFETAIEEGSTLVRVGSALFGSRG